MKVKTVLNALLGVLENVRCTKFATFLFPCFFLVFFKIDFFKTKIFICFNSPGLFVHLLCLSLVQEDFRTGFIFIVALTKKKCLPLKLFLRQIGPNWGSGLSKTIVGWVSPGREFALIFVLFLKFLTGCYNQTE